MFIWRLTFQTDHTCSSTYLLWRCNEKFRSQNGDAVELLLLVFFWTAAASNQDSVPEHQSVNDREQTRFRQGVVEVNSARSFDVTLLGVSVKQGPGNLLPVALHGCECHVNFSRAPSMISRLLTWPLGFCWRERWSLWRYAERIDSEEEKNFDLFQKEEKNHDLFQKPQRRNSLTWGVTRPESFIRTSTKLFLFKDKYGWEKGIRPMGENGLEFRWLEVHFTWGVSIGRLTSSCLPSQ